MILFTGSVVFVSDGAGMVWPIISGATSKLLLRVLFKRCNSANDDCCTEGLGLLSIIS